MAFDITTEQYTTGMTLEAEIWNGVTQDTNVGTAGQIALTENGTSGIYYATGISLASVTDGYYYIRIYDTIGTAYQRGITEIKIENELVYEDWVISSVTSGTDGQGYVDGFVYLDTNASNTNTVLGTDGIITNPVSTYAAAQTLCGSLGSKKIRVSTAGALALSLSANSDYYHFDGIGFCEIDTNSQSLSHAQFTNLRVTGTYTNSSTASPRFENCLIQSGGLTGRGGLLSDCFIVGGTFTAGDGSPWLLKECVIQGTLSFDAASIAVNLYANDIGGTIAYDNGIATCVVYLTGGGKFTNAAGSTITDLTLNGHWDYDNSGTVTNFYEDDINRVVDEIVDDTDNMEADLKTYGDANWITAVLTALETKAQADARQVLLIAEHDATQVDIGNLNDFDWTTDTVANVTLVATTTTNTDMVTAVAIADQVWDEDLSGHVIAGSAGEALAAAGAGTDPWLTALPGAYGAGTAGYIVGTNLDAVISARTLATADYFDPATDTVANVTLVATTTTNTDMRGTDGANTVVPMTNALSQSEHDATQVAIAALNNITVNDIWDELTAGHVTAGSFGVAITDILADTNELQTDWVDAGRLDLLLDETLLRARRAEQLSA